jgi:cellulose biosynthesis protein BcsQ
MKSTLIANSKGGCGKMTLATNLAGYFAALGARVMLSDLDRQQSSTQWLQRRSAELPIIHTILHTAKPHRLIQTGSSRTHLLDFVMKNLLTQLNKPIA